MTKNMSRKVLIPLISLVAFSFQALAQVSTPIVGFSTLPVRGKTGVNSALSLISINFSRPKAFSGVVGTKSLNGLGQTVITFDQSLFNTDQFNATSSPHFLQVKSGASNGLISQIVATSATSITLADNLNDILQDNNTAFDIIPYWTLSTALPNGAGLKTGTSANAADTISMVDPQTGVVNTYFYHSTANQWRRGNTDSSHVLISPGAGLLVTRKDPASVSILASGTVPAGPIQADIAAASSGASRSTFVANPFPLPSVTLANSGLYTGNPATGVVGGTSANSADNVIIFDPSTGAANTYFYSTSAGQWRRGNTDSSNVTIPEGASVIVSRKAGRGAFEWYIPQPAYAN